ncbi:hypothetical protein [Jannaschia formosa]|uniref:hypothetical protein n=1 Tax=Jannaschia formosa TaxID=2259592 RepID=UPI00142F5514|nr:hypothetical protein [Jannaschia formosa]
MTVQATDPVARPLRLAALLALLVARLPRRRPVDAEALLAAQSRREAARAAADRLLR